MKLSVMKTGRSSSSHSGSVPGLSRYCPESGPDKNGSRFRTSRNDTANKLFNITACLCWVLLTPILSLSQDTPVNTLTDAEEAAGWVLLFDGQDKNEHLQVGMDGGANDWVIDDGSLTPLPDSDGSEIYTKEKFSNFEFTVDWKINTAGNSGIFFRANPPRRICSSSEYAILDGENGGDRTAMGYLPGETNMPIKATGANYDLYPTTENGEVGGAYVDLSNPIGEYNRSVIMANGDNIENWLNDKLVVKYQLGSDEWQERFELSKYYGICPDNRDTWARESEGYIGMQDHGDGLLVWIQNIKIRPFTPGEKLVQPIFTPAPGSFNSDIAVTMEAAITGSRIYYTLDGTTPSAATGTLYTGPVSVTQTANLQAVTVRDGFESSDPFSGNYELTHTNVSAPGRPFDKLDVKLTDRVLHIEGSAEVGEAYTAALQNLKGEQLFLKSVSSKNRQFNLEHLPGGLFLLRLETGKAEKVFRVLLD